MDEPGVTPDSILRLIRDHLARIEKERALRSFMDRSQSAQLQMLFLQVTALQEQVDWILERMHRED